MSVCLPPQEFSTAKLLELALLAEERLPVLERKVGLPEELHVQIETDKLEIESPT